MRKSLTRAVAGVAVAGAAMMTLAGPAGAAPAHVRAHTTLSIAAFKSTIKDGRHDVISGRLVHDKTGLAWRTVSLDRRYGKKWEQVRVGRTGPRGWISFWVWPGRTARYELTYQGSNVDAPTHSGVVTVKVTH